MIDLGQTVRERRGAMGLSLEALSRELGGSPGQTFLSKIERGAIGVSPNLATRLAKALRVPEPVVLNSAGHATDDQVEAGLRRFKEITAEPAPIAVTLPVLDAGGRTVASRSRLMAAKEDAFLIDLSGIPNEPFVGEALVLTGRPAEDGIGVVVEIDGGLSAWTYHVAGSTRWIENMRGEKRAKGYTIRGIIARVASERVFVE